MTRPAALWPFALVFAVGVAWGVAALLAAQRWTAPEPPAAAGAPCMCERSVGQCLCKFNRAPEPSGK